MRQKCRKKRPKQSWIEESIYRSTIKQKPRKIAGRFLIGFIGFNLKTGNGFGGMLWSATQMRSSLQQKLTNGLSPGDRSHGCFAQRGLFRWTQKNEIHQSYVYTCFQ